ncbi:MAG: DmsC/YnfH family molybdoenzyme membrane anchor subunit [Planctomycetota bacterium]
MTAISNNQQQTGPESRAAQHAEQQPGDLLRSLLEESRQLTAVERFAKAHDEGEPELASHYRDLIPLSAPGEGEQYAFEVDLDACSGCKACVSACHHMNGLDPGETWRAVGQLYGANGLPIIQHVTTACHHCVDPGCLNGCPTNAYEKDRETGIVRHLDDQCFGCQYCTMACPYEVPQYSPSKGIVRKCDMCHSRLSEGEAPACVQACPNEAIKISVVSVADAKAKAAAGEFLPSSPPPELTKPTTIYRGERPLPASLRAADADHIAPQHAHLPLVFMLVLTQASVGAVATGAVARWAGYEASAAGAMIAGTLAGLFGLALAPLHLGRPHLAFRSVLGWRHSWLSREAIVFGLYAPLAIGAAALAAMPWLRPIADPYLPAAVGGLLDSAIAFRAPIATELLAVLSGAAAVFCSAKIYQFTGRAFWLGWRTGAKFAGTAVVLGLSLMLAAAAAAEYAAGITSPLSLLIGAVTVATIVKLVYEATTLNARTNHSLALSSRLMTGQLQGPTVARFVAGGLGGVLLPVAVAACGVGSLAAAVLAVASFGLLLVGELLERYLYFAAVVPLRMPGGVKS